MKIAKIIAGIVISTVLILYAIEIYKYGNLAGWCFLLFIVLTWLNIIKTPAYYNSYSTYLKDIREYGLINNMSKWGN